jgi:predicted neutral ceramidase superfamily lipid hydrolase
VKSWLSNYVADGWWRRGSLTILISLTKAIALLASAILILYAIPNNFGSGSIPSALYLSSMALVALVIITVLWAIGYASIKLTEASFLRYVSQNVAYTSAIILKRAVKAKVDIGLILLTALYIPLIYTMLQATICK